MARRLTFTVLVLALLPGCALLRDLLALSSSEPAARFVSAEVTEANLDSATVTVKYVVDNPTPLPLNVTAVDYAFFVDGTQVQVPAPAPGATIPAGGQLELAFPAKLAFAGGDGANAVAGYEARGAVTVTTAAGAQQLPLAYTGSLERPRRPTVAIGGLPRFGSGPGGPTLELPLSIENPNAFALPLKLSGGLSLFGIRVAALSGNDLGALSPREKKQVTVPLSFALQDAVMGALQAAVTGGTGAAMPIAFDGDLESGAAKIPVQWAQALSLPSLAMTRTSFSDWSLDGVTLNVHLAGQNPDAAPLALGAPTTRLLVNGAPAASLLPPPAQTLAPGGASELVLPVRFKFADLASGIVSMLQKRTATYQLDGSVGVPTQLGTIALPLKQAGSIELPQLPKLALRAPRLSSLTLTQATLELPLEVTNPNAFAVPVSAVTGNLALAGVHIGQLTAGDLGQLAAGASRTVTLPLTFNLLQAAAAATALRSGSGAFAFDGSVQSGQLTVPVKWTQTLAISR